MNTTSTTVPQTAPASSTASRLRPAVLTIVAAMVAAGIGWAIARAAVGEDLTVAFNGSSQVVSIGSVLGTTLLAGLVGWGSLALLRRISAQGTRIWVIVAAVFTLLSFSGPASAQASTGTKIGLVLLHLLVAAVLIPGLSRQTHARVD